MWTFPRSTTAGGFQGGPSSPTAVTNCKSFSHPCPCLPVPAVAVPRFMNPPVRPRRSRLGACELTPSPRLRASEERVRLRLLFQRLNINATRYRQALAISLDSASKFLQVRFTSNSRSSERNDGNCQFLSTSLSCLSILVDLCHVKDHMMRQLFQGHDADKGTIGYSPPHPHNVRKV